MSAWGNNTNGMSSSSNALLERIERNDSSLPDLILLPMRKIDDVGWNRLIAAISQRGTQPARCLTSIQASGHDIASHETVTRLGRAIHASSFDVPWKCIAVGKSDMGDDGVVALCTGLAGGGGGGDDDGDDGDCSSSSSNTGSSSAALLRLEALDLSFKGMKTGAGLLSIIRLCQDCTFLKSVNLSRNAGICGAGHQEGSGGVVENFFTVHHHTGVIFPYIEDLDLSSCNITGQVVGAQLLNSLSWSKNLSILRLSNNPLFGSITAAAATAALGLILQRLPTLRELHLSNCQIDDETMQALPWTTDAQTSLQVLDLSMNQIGANGGDGGGIGGIQALALGLATFMTSLVDLNLAGNPLMFKGVECLVCNGLVKRREQQQQQSSSLQSLDLSETKCTGPGAALVIAQSGVRKSLRLYNNDLQANHGFETNIAPCLVGGHVTMECLDLSGNGANEAAVVNLLRGLLEQVNAESTFKLQTLIVGGNAGGDNVEELVGQILKVRPGLDIARDKRGSRMQS
jgi:Leucine Rich repeat